MEKEDNSKPISSQTSLKLEIEEYKKLLEEEKWYSNDLKDELKTVQKTNDELQAGLYWLLSILNKIIFNRLDIL